MRNSIDISKIAGIECHGISGLTQSCIDAIVHVINSGKKIDSAWLLSWFDGDNIGEHSFLLNISPARQVLIKPGFRSGYSGEAPSGLSTALQILQLHNIEIEEYEINQAVKERLEMGCLLSSDLDKLEKSRPIRPTRYYDYILKLPNSQQETYASNVQQHFPIAINLGSVRKPS